MNQNPDRVPLLVWVGVFLALALIGATTIHLIRHPPKPPQSACPPSDAANRWCVHG